MPTHKIATREEWLAARAALLEREKEHTRIGDELARQRRELPWVSVEKEYTLQTADGPKTLAELFDSGSQLLIYHFMFGPSYEAGCPVNSSIADTFDSLIPHLKARDVTLIAVSGASIERLLAYRERMGWPELDEALAGAQTGRVSQRKNRPAQVAPDRSRPARRPALARNQRFSRNDIYARWRSRTSSSARSRWPGKVTGISAAE